MRQLDSVPEREFTSTEALLLYVFVGCCYINNAMDRTMFPQLVPYIRQYFHMTLVQSGFISTMFTLGMGLGGIPAGYLLDRYSRKWVVVLGICIYSAFTLLNTHAFGFWSMTTNCVITGIGEAIQQTALYTMLAMFFFRTRTLMLGGMNVFYGVGAFVGPNVGVWIFLRTGQHWQIPLYYFGFMGFAICIVWILFAPKAFTDFTGNSSSKATFTLKEDHLPDGVLSRNLILISILNIMVGFSSFSSQGMYPTFLKTHLGFNPATTAWCASMYGLGSFLGLPAGYLGDKLNQKWVVFVAIFISMCSGYSMYNFATRPGTQAFLMFLVGGFGTGCLFPNVYALTQRSVKKAYLGRASGLASSAHYGPALLAGGFFAWLVSHMGWGKGAIVTWIVCPLISLVCILLFDYDKTSRLVKNPAAEPSATTTA